MAEKDEPKAQQPQETPAQQASRAFAESQAAAQQAQMTETVPGGRYRIGDQLVDAHGQPVKDSQD